MRLKCITCENTILPLTAELNEGRCGVCQRLHLGTQRLTHEEEIAFSASSGVEQFEAGKVDQAVDFLYGLQVSTNYKVLDMHFDDFPKLLRREILIFAEAMQIDGEARNGYSGGLTTGHDFPGEEERRKRIVEINQAQAHLWQFLQAHRC